MLLSFLLILVIFESDVTASVIQCWSCSYIHGPASPDSECLTEPDKVKTAKIVVCDTNIYSCFTKEVYGISHGFVTSFTRGCFLKSSLPAQSECVTGGQSRTCTVLCTTEFCNDVKSLSLQAAISSGDTGRRNPEGNNRRTTRSPNLRNRSTRRNEYNHSSVIASNYYVVCATAIHMFYRVNK